MNTRRSYTLIWSIDGTIHAIDHISRDWRDLVDCSTDKIENIEVNAHTHCVQCDAPVPEMMEAIHRTETVLLGLDSTPYYAWLEYHQCPICGHKYWVHNCT